MLELIAFASATSAITFFSWRYLRDLHHHGFFRFFAFESILAVVLLNLDEWFNDPFSSLQLLSWVLLACSLFLVVQGFYLLRKVGRPQGPIESTTTLVSLGAYRYIRHPLYSSLLLLGWGAFLKDLSTLGGIFVLLTTAFLVATARVEEGENLRKFGKGYSEYVRTTKMFIPFLF